MAAAAFAPALTLPAASGAIPPPRHLTGIVAVAAAARIPIGAVALGATPSNQIETGAVVLKPRDEAALKSFIAAVTDKRSPMFHQYLAPGAYRERFGPTPVTIAAVVSELRAEGLTVGSVAGDGLLVDFSAPASRIEAAFSTGIERYRLPDGSIGQATTGPIHVPAAISGSVETVVGLDNLVREQSAGMLRAPSSMKGTHPSAIAHAFTLAAGQATACADASAAATLYGGLTDDQIANAYGATPLYRSGDLGAGQTVAVYELEPFDPSDIQTFDQCYFPSDYSTVFGNLESEYTSSGATAAALTIDGGQPAGYGSGEAVLDIEDVSAIAPAAKIEVYEAPNTTFGGIDEYSAIVNQDTSNVVTSSWGLCEQAVQQGEPGIQQAENLLFEQAAAQGQSVFAAAGDTGSNDCNAARTPTPVPPILSVDDPGSQPYVVSVGGTTITDATQPPEEHVWNDGAEWGAGGGGISQSWTMPAWQEAARVPGIDNQSVVSSAEKVMGDFCLTSAPASTIANACREVPDVTAQADEFTGAITVYSASFGPGATGWITIGGTSSATPLWASMLALVNSSPTCAASKATASGVGFVSPLLYAVASSPVAYAASFNDIVTGNDDPYGATNLFPATPGYDMASGLGSPQLTHDGGAGLAYYLCSAAQSGSRPTISSVLANYNHQPFAPTGVIGVNATITGTGFQSNGAGVVAAVHVGTLALPQAYWSVTSATTISVVLPTSIWLTPPGDPTDGAGSYQVVVSLLDGESSMPGSASSFEYVDETGGNVVPAVTSVRTLGGPEAGGNTVQIFGTGFSGATAVDFGGVPATSFTVVQDWEITATVPAYAASGAAPTTCAQDGSSYGETAADDICQVAVTVTNTHGTSSGGSLNSCQGAIILPDYEGMYSANALGVIPAPDGEEAAPQPCEYDYFPSPAVTSISTSAGPSYYAGEQGGSLITLRGSGFNLAGLDWVDFFGTDLAAYQDFNLVSVSGTEIQLVAPAAPPTLDAQQVPVYVRTLAGLSASVNATYAGIPQVTGLSIAAAPDNNPTPLTIDGAGLSDAIGVEFVDHFTPYSVGTQYDFSVTGDSAIGTTTVPQNPALVDVEVCTATTCGYDYPADSLLLYPPGSPTISSVVPSTGPAHGGATVTINGQNLGCVTAVRFGSTPAEQFSNVQAILDCGSTTQVVVTVPPGVAGASVPVTVATVESDQTGSSSNTNVMYKYTPSTPSAPTLRVVPGGGGATLSWTPPASDGGDPVTGYRVTASSPGRPPVDAAVGAATTSYTVPDLQPGVPWTFEVLAVSTLGAGLPATSQAYTLAPGDNGYLVATAAGGVFGFGSLSSAGGVSGRPDGRIVGLAATPDALGYYEVTSTGYVYAFGDAVWHGNATIPTSMHVVGMAATPDGGGYWLVTDTGDVYSFGNARYHGGWANAVNVVGIASTPDGGGYFIARAGGAVKAFGDGFYRGDMAQSHLNKPIVGIAVNNVTGGYWLVGGDGGVFSFGAGFYGSMQGRHLNQGAVGMVGTPDGKGYWLVASDNGVFTFGSARYAGNPMSETSSPGAAIASAS